MNIQYKNININYSDYGSGAVVVLLHGFLENLNMWENLRKDLGNQYRVLAIDLLGHGKTACLGYIHTMEEMAEVVNAVLESLNIKKANFVGHSMGGYVTLALAEKYPDKVGSICLLNSTSESDSVERQLNRERAINAVKQNHKAFISMAISNLFAENNRKKLQAEIDQIKEEAYKMPLQGIIAALEGMKIRKNRTTFFKSLPIKKMLIYGAKDTVLNAEHLIGIFEKSDVEMLKFPDGHMSYLENKKDLAYNILHFIEK